MFLSQLQKTNLLLATVIAVVIALAGDVVLNVVFSAILGPEQKMSTIVNLVNLAMALVMLAGKGKANNRFTFSAALPAILSAIN